MSVHIYSVSADTLNSKVATNALHAEVLAGFPSLVNDFDGILFDEPDGITITFNVTLTGPQIVTLNGIVNAHTGVPLPRAGDDATLEPNPPTADDGYSIGDIWVDTSNGSTFIFVEDNGVAVWRPLASTLNLDGYSTEGSVAVVGDQVTNIQVSLDGYALTSDVGSPNGIASLDAGGKIPAGQIPAVALPEVFVVLDDTERLALTVQEGDEAIQTSDGYHYIYDGYDWYLRPGNDIAAHVADLDNPHDTGFDNLLPGTLAELNAIITDATLDDSGDPRDPNAHAPTHEDGGSDELTAQNLGSAAAVSGKIMQTDGAGGWVLIDTPTSVTETEICYFDGYDTAGGTSITGTWTDVPLDSVRIKDTPYIHTLSNAEVMFNEGGIYTIWGRVTTDHTSGSSRTQTQMRAAFDDGSGYIEVPGTRGSTYNRLSTQGEATASAAFTLTVEAGYKVKLQVIRSSGGGPIQLLPNGSSLLIARFKGIKGDQGPSGDGYLTIQDEGTNITNTPHGTINFVGSGVTVTDNSGVATVTVSGGGSGSGKMLYPFGATDVGTNQYLKTAGSTTLGHKTTVASTLKAFSVLTDTVNNNTYIVEKNGSTVASNTFSAETEKVITGLSTAYAQGDKVNVRVEVAEDLEDINNPYTDDGYTLFLTHIDGSTEASRNIINISTNFTGLGGKVDGATLGATGKFNKAADFDGSNDYIEILHQDEMDTQDCTIEFWFNSDSVGDNKTLFSKDSSGYDTGGHLDIQQSGTNDIVIRSQTTSSSKEHEITDADIVAGTWYHLAVVLGTGGMKLFLDGVLKHTDVGWTQGLNGNREPITLGAGQQSSGDSIITPLNNYFDGKICELRISDVRRYESGFTPAVSQFSSDGDTVGLWHFDETSGVTIDGISGTVCNAMAQASTSSFPEIETTIVKFGTESVKLNNSQNDWLRQIHHSNYEQDEVTVEAWLYVFDSGDGMVFQKGDSSMEGGLEVKFEQTNPHLEVTYYGATTSRTIITSNNSFPKNAWHHFAVTLDANNFEVFIDGVSVGIEVLTSDFQNIWNNNTDDIFWGKQSNDTNFLQAYYDEMRISNTVRNFDGSEIDISVIVEMEE